MFGNASVNFGNIAVWCYFLLMAFILKSERFAIHYREKFMSGNTDVLMKTKIFLVKICIWILFQLLQGLAVQPGM